MTSFSSFDQTLRIGSIVVGAFALLAGLRLFALEIPGWFFWPTLAAGAFALTAGCVYAATPAHRWLIFATTVAGLACGIAAAWASWTAPRAGWTAFASLAGYAAILAALALGVPAGWREYEKISGSVPVTKG